MSGSSSHLVWSEVTAFFGGRFDPPHLGHREAVRGLFRDPGVQRVIIVPSAVPPHKTAFASAEQRLKMATLNFSSTPSDPLPLEIQIDSRELDRSKINSERPSYTFDTLQELQPLYRNLAFVIGTDQLEQLPTWHRFPEVLALSHWIVLSRKPNGQETALRTLQQWEGSGVVVKAPQTHLWRIGRSGKFLSVVPTEAPALSSTTIRQALAKNGAPPEGALLPEIQSYLKDQKLYGI